VSLLRMAIKQKAGSMIRPFLLAECSEFVIASQRVGAKRRPMTGSAKQSILAL